jgi:hypothetical protein
MVVALSEMTGSPGGVQRTWISSCSTTRWLRRISTPPGICSIIGITQRVNTHLKAEFSGSGARNSELSSCASHSRTIYIFIAAS